MLHYKVVKILLDDVECAAISRLHELLYIYKIHEILFIWLNTMSSDNNEIDLDKLNIIQIYMSDCIW